MRLLFCLLSSLLPTVVSAVDFENDIIPVLTKAGCNTGACHGAAVGRGGLRLSLYGGDPQADFQAIVRELEGRRVNLADPEQSLVVLKPTETIEHGGGQRLDANDEGARLLTAWITAGAGAASENQINDAQRPRLVRLSVDPSRHVASIDEPGLQLTAIALFSDGSTRDVTRWTVFTPEDPSAVQIDTATARTIVQRRGRHVVVARYLNKVVPIEIMLPLSDQDVARDRRDRSGLIDGHVIELLDTLRIPLSGHVDDAAFLRRISLDLTGRLPDRETTLSYIADSPSPSREELVDTLLESAAFNEFWTLQLAKLLRLHGQPQDMAGAVAYHHWLHQQLVDHVGYDDLTRNILTATGDSHSNGPANFYRTVGGPREQAELMSEVFMGNRLRCANCHNHPFDRWTQDDYHGLAAIFARVRSGKVVTLNERGVVIHPKTGLDAVPRIPGERILDDGPSSATDDPRDSLARWLTDAENPFFAKAIVNRLWKAMMGRGLVEPTDDLRATNPATHPNLLNELAGDFVEGGFDLRRTLRLIALSDAYGRSVDAVDGNQNDDRFYSRHIRKPLPPEVLADAISDVLEVSEMYGEEPLGTRAVSLIDPKTASRSLDILGRCDREETCETSGTPVGGGLTLKLHLFNGELLNRRITSPDGRLAQLQAAGKTSQEIVDSFYAVALQRHPQEQERTFWEEQLGDSPGHSERLEDFVWSLLTCNEFTTNH